MAPYDLSDKLYIVALATAAIIGIITNSFIISVVRKRRELHTPSYYFLANQAASDILTMVCEIFTNAGIGMLYDDYIIVRIWVGVMGTLYASGIKLSSCFIFLNAIERFGKLYFPAWYKINVKIACY